jgi:peptidoglycan/LPS O-acetylase OafA/YrhL
VERGDKSEASISAGAASVRRGRLEFLDALRGLAALSVAAQHGAELLWPGYLRFSVEVFRPGEFGVFLFFLCSGFIIPTSLERYQDLRRFWIARGFRLFPLYWACLLTILILHYGWRLYPLPDHVGRGSWLINLTMLQDFTGKPLIIGASWTLAYEMCFYIGCSVLWLVDLHRRSSAIAVSLLYAGAFGAVLVPSLALTGPGLTNHTLVLSMAATLGFVGPMFWLTRNRDWKLWVVITVMSAIAIPLVINRPEPWFFAMMLFGTMFTGTVLHRWHRGETSGRTAVVIVLIAVSAMAIGHYLNVPDRIDHTLADAYHSWRPEALTYAAAVAVFGAGLALRHRQFPRWLIYLGTISYSVYLVHAVVIYVVPPVDNSWLTFATWMTVILGASSITYLMIEKPFQAFGHRLTEKLKPSVPSRPILLQVDEQSGNGSVMQNSMAYAAQNQRPDRSATS